MKLKYLSLAVMTMGAVGLAGGAYASGYHFGSQSVSTQGTANASSAEAADASTIFYNAAGMTKLPGTHFSGVLDLVAPSVKYSGASGTTPPTTSTPSGTAIRGSSSGKITEDLVAVPHFYVTRQINDKVTAGLGVYVPFASSTKYQPDSVLRYNVNETELKTIDINPTVAFKLNDQHSVAVGVIAQHAEAGLKQYANFAQSAAGYYSTLAAQAAAAGNATLAAQYRTAAGQALAQDGTGALDGYSKVKGDDWGFGFNLAWMWDITDSTRVGLNYRSKINHTLEGTAEWTTPNGTTGTIVQGLGYRTSDAKVKIETPESLSLHGMHKLNPKWKLFGDLTWTRHSRFDRVAIEYAIPKITVNPAVPATATILEPKWKNTLKLALGASYQYSDPLLLRFGVAYDQSPVPDADHRLSTIPDNDRIWFSLGGRYALNKNSSIDLAYSYIHIKDTTANVNGYCGGTAPRQVNCVSSYTRGTASYKSHAQILGVQYNYNF